MRYLLVVGLFACGMAQAQTTITHEEWQREYNLSQVLAGKLFPDLTHEGTPLLHQYSQITNIMASCPAVAHDSIEPLYVAVLAAQFTGVSPKWDNLSDGEKLEAFQELAYMSNKAALFSLQQGKYIAQMQGGGGSPPDTSFNPDALTGPAHAMYAPSQDKSYNVIDSHGNSSVITVSPSN